MEGGLWLIDPVLFSVVELEIGRAKLHEPSLGGLCRESGRQL